jgi:hypothetical protein
MGLISSWTQSLSHVRIPDSYRAGSWGSDAGFEIYYDDSPKLLNAFRNIAQGRDYCISFRWGGSMVECASVMIVSYALAKKFDAIVSYEGGEPYEDMDAFLADIQACIEEAKKGS